MRKRLLGSLAALAASAGLAHAQPAAPPAATRAPAAAAVAPGRSVAGGVADAVPIGPAMTGQPDNGFAAAMQAQPMPGYGDVPPEGGQEPRPDTECAYGQVDYLLYFINSQRSNYPLVSVGTTAGFGAVGPGTSVLFGANNFRFNPFSGARFTVGGWWRQNTRLGAEFSATVLETRSDDFVGGFGTQVVARPVIDANSGQPVSLIVAAPGFAGGGVEARATSQFWGFETNARLKFFCNERGEVTGSLGFRYADLFERLTINQRTLFVPNITVPFYGLLFNPTEIDVADMFATRNQYLMANLGLQAKWRYRRWCATWTGKFAIGNDHQTSDIQGNSTLFVGTGNNATVNQVPGGLLATSSNIGRYHSDVFTYMPEAQFQLGYRLLRSTDIVVGYQFLYMSRAIRPGTQVDAVVNPVFVPTSAFFGAVGGPSRPAPQMTQVDFWVQGFNFGVHVHF